MASRLSGNFAQSRVPTVGESMRGMFQDFNKSRQNIMANELAGEELRMKQQAMTQAQSNADRTYDIQKAAADNQDILFNQKQDEFKRAQAQRAMEEAVYSTENSSSPVAGNVNALYDQFNKKYDGIIPGGTDVDAYTSELDALNQSAIYDHFGGDSQGKTQVNNAQAAPYFDGRDDALATKGDLLQKIMAGGNYTAAEADALATKELTRRFPLASAESIKNAQAQEKTIYDAKIKLLAKNSDGSGMTVDPETGAVSFGSGAFKTVSTQHDKPELIASTVKDIATSKDLTGTLSGMLFGETRPTEGNLYKARNVLSEMGYDDTQIATGLRSGIQYQWLTDDALATPATIARYMGKPSASSVKTTNKGGSGSASSANTQAAYQKLTDDYRARNAAIAGSGIHQGATQARYNTERPITPTKSISEIIKEKSEQKALDKKQKQAEANAAIIEQQRIAAELQKLAKAKANATSSKDNADSPVTVNEKVASYEDSLKGLTPEEVRSKVVSDVSNGLLDESTSFISKLFNSQTSGLKNILGPSVGNFISDTLSGKNTYSYDALKSAKVDEPGIPQGNRFPKATDSLKEGLQGLRSAENLPIDNQGNTKYAGFGPENKSAVQYVTDWYNGPSNTDMITKLKESAVNQAIAGETVDPKILGSLPLEYRKEVEAIIANKKRQIN